MMRLGQSYQAISLGRYITYLHSVERDIVYYGEAHWPSFSTWIIPGTIKE